MNFNIMEKLKYLLSLLLFTVSLTINAQTPEFLFNGTTDVMFRYPPRGSGGRALVHDSGNLLTINSGGDFSGGTRIGNEILLANDGTLRIPDGKFFKASQFTTNDYSTMTFTSRAWETVQGPNGKAFSFQTHNDIGGGGFEMLAIYYGENGKIILTPNGGNVGIGTSTPNAKLAVNGNIRAKEIKVETANWPDYVFAKDYQLPSLKETEQHIKDKGHLPGIPSAEEVKTNGVNLGEMNAKLLKKIEELTLILIQLNEKVEQQSETLEKQQKQLDKVKFN
jgi:hypothetical protein